MSEKILGIIGGVGPMSTIYFEELVTRLTKAKKDQDHLDMVILNHASIPDRTDFIVGKSDVDPLPAMRRDAKILESLGVSYIAIPCNTAHYFYDEIASSVRVPIINIIRETVQYIKKALPHAKKVGLLATRGTVAAGSYQHTLLSNGLTPVLPAPPVQSQIMHIIYDQVKAGKPVDIDAFRFIMDKLKQDGCDALILGCTELSVIRRDFHLNDASLVDSLEVLAVRSILLCEKKLEREVNIQCADL